MGQEAWGKRLPLAGLAHAGGPSISSAMGCSFVGSLTRSLSHKSHTGDTTHQLCAGAAATNKTHLILPGPLMLQWGDRHHNKNCDTSQRRQLRGGLRNDGSRIRGQHPGPQYVPRAHKPLSNSGPGARHPFPNRQDGSQARTAGRHSKCVHPVCSLEAKCRVYEQSACSQS